MLLGREVYFMALRKLRGIVSLRALVSRHRQGSKYTGYTKAIIPPSALKGVQIANKGI